METPVTSVAYGTDTKPYLAEKTHSAISWPAILGGAFVALAITAVLGILGSGLGLAVTSPYAHVGPSAKTLGVLSIIWMILVQWASSATGGYITGRLRTRWVNVHTHEVFFRDTAHGFVTWAVATVLTFAVLASFASMAGRNATHLAAGAMAGQHQEANRGSEPSASPMAYYTDTLFRASPTSAAPAGTVATPATPSTPPAMETNSEANRILVKGLKDGGVSDEDKAYLAQLVSSRTGLDNADARKRVDDVLARQSADEAKARDMANAARKAGATLSLCIALSLMVGAFVASVAAALGGNLRDRHN